MEVSLKRTPSLNLRLLETKQKQRATEWFLGLNNLTAAIAGALGGKEGGEALKSHFEQLRSVVADGEPVEGASGYTEVSPTEFMRHL